MVDSRRLPPIHVFSRDVNLFEDNSFKRKMSPRRRAAMREAIVRTLYADERGHVDGLGLGWGDIVIEVAQRVPRDMFPTARKIVWHCRAVLVELEAGWILERVPDGRPRRWRLTGIGRGLRRRPHAPERWPRQLPEGLKWPPM